MAMDIMAYKEVLTDICQVLSSQESMTFQLGILSKVTYKHYNAQRKQKHFGALKKIERNFRKFVNLELLSTTENQLALKDICTLNRHGKKVQTLVYHGFLLLNEVCRNCCEVVSHSLQQMRIERFVKFHLLLISLSSTIFQLAKDILSKMETWTGQLNKILTDINPTELPDIFSLDSQKLKVKNAVSLKCHESLTEAASPSGEDKSENTIFDLSAHRDLDLGVVVERKETFNNTSTSIAEADTLQQIPVPVPILCHTFKERRVVLTKSQGDTYELFSVPNDKCIKTLSGIIEADPYEQFPVLAIKDKETSDIEDFPEQFVAPVLSENWKETPTVTTEDNSFAQSTVVDAIHQVSPRFKNKSKMSSKFPKRKLKHSRLHNVPLKLKRYHNNFNTHCARTRRFKIIMQLKEHLIA